MMDLFKMARLKKSPKNTSSTSVSLETPHTDSPSLSDSAPGAITAETSTSTSTSTSSNEKELGDEEEDDDDFITNEVKRRLKELRKNSFMVLIPEEEATPDDDNDNGDDTMEDTGLADVPFGLEAFNAWLCGFDSLYDKYCQRMLFFDRSIIASLSHSPGFLHI